MDLVNMVDIFLNHWSVKDILIMWMINLNEQLLGNVPLRPLR